MPRPLGSRQKNVLIALYRHGKWVDTPCTEWMWSTHKITYKILNSLVDRDLVELWGNTYTLTDEGYAMVRQLLTPQGHGFKQVIDDD